MTRFSRSTFSRRVALRIPDDPPRRAGAGDGVSGLDGGARVRTNIEPRPPLDKKMSF
jgi:hypothetical protein